MTLHFLKYITWSGYQLAKERTNGVCAYSASKKFVTLTGKRKVSAGDVIWTFTVPPNKQGKGLSGRLCLVGRLVVSEVPTRDKDKVAFHIGVTREKLWGASDRGMWYVLGDRAATQDYVQIDQEGLAAAVRFEGGAALTLENGLIREFMQVNEIRALSTETISLFEGLMPVTPVVMDDPFPLSDLLTPSSEPAAIEGGRKLVAHWKLERDRMLVSQAKQHFKTQHGGKLFCEVCTFDYARRYGELGDNFIEAHHRVPLSELAAGTLTRIADLAMVCANCHRMLHRRTPWLIVEQLREIVQRRVA